MAEKAKDLPGQKSLIEGKSSGGVHPAIQPGGSGFRPKMSERDRFILAELLAASKACKSQVKRLRGGQPVQPAIVSAASTLAVAYRTEMMALGA